MIEATEVTEAIEVTEEVEEAAEILTGLGEEAEDLKETIKNSQVC